MFCTGSFSLGTSRTIRRSIWSAKYGEMLLYPIKPLSLPYIRQPPICSYGILPIRQDFCKTDRLWRSSVTSSTRTPAGLADPGTFSSFFFSLRALPIFMFCFCSLRLLIPFSSLFTGILIFFFSFHVAVLKFYRVLSY